MFKFGKFTIPQETVFVETEYSFAFTNLKCFRPGHVLVASKRVVQFVNQLSPVEQEDLIRTVQAVAKCIKAYYNADKGLCIAIQDGVNAGQTVPHVHYHIIPKVPEHPSTHTKQYYDLIIPGEIPMLKSCARPVEEQIAEATAYRVFIEKGYTV